MTIGSLFHLVSTFQLQIALVLKRVHIFLITSQIVLERFKLLLYALIFTIAKTTKMLTTQFRSFLNRHKVNSIFRSTNDLTHNFNII